MFLWLFSPVLLVIYSFSLHVSEKGYFLMKYIFAWCKILGWLLYFIIYLFVCFSFFSFNRVISFHSHWLWREIYCHLFLSIIIHLYVTGFFFLLAAFHIFYDHFWAIFLLHFGTVWYSFLHVSTVWFFWDSWILPFTIFTKFGNLLAIISLNIYLPTYFLQAI